MARPPAAGTTDGDTATDPWPSERGKLAEPGFSRLRAKQPTSRSPSSLCYPLFPYFRPDHRVRKPVRLALYLDSLSPLFYGSGSQGRGVSWGGNKPAVVDGRNGINAGERRLIRFPNKKQIWNSTWLTFVSIEKWKTVRGNWSLLFSVSFWGRRSQL